MGNSFTVICFTNTPFRSSASRSVVSLAAVIKVVTQRSVSGEERGVTTLITVDLLPVHLIITAAKATSGSEATYFVLFLFQSWKTHLKFCPLVKSRTFSEPQPAVNTEDGSSTSGLNPRSLELGKEGEMACQISWLKTCSKKLSVSLYTTSKPKKSSYMHYC